MRSNCEKNDLFPIPFNFNGRPWNLNFLNYQLSKDMVGYKKYKNVFNIVVLIFSVNNNSFL